MEKLDIRNPFPSGACFRLAETGSTMDEARELARRGFPVGSLVLADSQSAGRGRLPGRSWLAPPGQALLATLILGPEAQFLPGLSLRLGLALARAVARALGHEGKRAAEPLRIKWPNDLIAGGKKLAGLLCEAAEGRVFAGFGINIGQASFPPELEGRATSLSLLAGSELGGESFRFGLLELALEEIGRVLGEEDWRQEVEALLWRRGEAVRFREGLPGQGRLLAARLEGLGPDGSLLLGLEKGGPPEAFRSGELLPPETGASGYFANGVDPEAAII